MQHIVRALLLLNAAEAALVQAISDENCISASEIALTNVEVRALHYSIVFGWR